MACLPNNLDFPAARNLPGRPIDLEATRLPTLKLKESYTFTYLMLGSPFPSPANVLSNGAYLNLRRWCDVGVMIYPHVPFYDLRASRSPSCRPRERENPPNL